MKKANLEKINKIKQITERRQKASKPSEYNLLAIDPATKCGIAVEKSGKSWSVELWDLSRKSNESDGLKWMRFRAKLKDFCIKMDIHVIGYEMPAGRHAGAVIHHAKLAGIIEEAAAELNIECKAYPCNVIKQLATGKGNAGKPDMIKAAQQRLGYLGSDDNEADSLWLLQLMKSDL